MKNKIVICLNVVSTALSAALGVLYFNKAENTNDKKRKVLNYILGTLNFIIAALEVKVIADKLLLPEPEEIIAGSMEDVSEEKDFVDADIAAEE